MQQPDYPAYASKARNLRIGSLLLKLVLTIVTFIMTYFAYIANGSDGSKQHSRYKSNKDDIKMNYVESKVEWSQEDTVDTEDKGFILTIIALVACILSSILQCVVTFLYKTPSTTSKVVISADAVLCFAGMALMLVAASMLIHGSGKHCNKERETVLFQVLITEKSQMGEEGLDGGSTTITTRVTGRPHTFFGEKADDKLFGDPHSSSSYYSDELFVPYGGTYEGTPEEDKLQWSLQFTFNLPGENIPTRSDSFLMKYRKKCKKRWSTTGKIIAGVLGIFASLGFIGAGVLSLLQGLLKNPAAQNASQLQQGAYQPGGLVYGPQPQVTPTYAAVYPPPPYQQQGYQPQPTPGYVAVHSPQFQQSYQPQQEPPPQYQPQGYQPQGVQYQQGYQTQPGGPTGGGGQ